MSDISPTHPPADAVQFWKMSGGGNDFVVIDNRHGAVPESAVAGFAKSVCRHRLSVGADGIVLISDPEPLADASAHFAWRYINADGGDGEMCGNGAMCGARFAVLNGIAPHACAFATAAGLVRAVVASDPADPRVRIAVGDPGLPTLDLDLEVEGIALRLHRIRVGVPHAVAFVDDADGFAPGSALSGLGRAVRQHAAFAPEGTNLDIISPMPGGALRMRTYERGVEAETLACGTGAIAGAIVAAALGLARPPVAILTSGGLTLHADFAWDGVRATQVTLQGEARVIATGAIHPEALL
ncbi:MAG: diaminopimelate epimerase [Thermomicrobiales bacterium]